MTGKKKTKTGEHPIFLTKGNTFHAKVPTKMVLSRAWERGEQGKLLSEERLKVSLNITDGSQPRECICALRCTFEEV